MKNKLPSFLSGFVAAIVIFALTIGVLATNGTVDFSTVNLSFNGEKVGNAGEYYQLTNGALAPYSISYYDEQGGGTTYLPVRKISELMGVDIQWDGSTNTVRVSGEVATNEAPSNDKIDNESIDTGKLILTSLVKIDGHYYTISGQDMHYRIPYYVVGDLVFADQDIDVVHGSYYDTIHPYMCVSWYLMLPIKLALMTTYSSTDFGNPFIQEFSYEYDEERFSQYNAGIDETVWYSATSSYTPMWLEINGIKIYNLNPTDDANQTINQIRHYQGKPCINDILRVANIDATITFGEYQGLYYMEIQ